MDSLTHDATQITNRFQTGSQQQLQRHLAWRMARQRRSVRRWFLKMGPPIAVNSRAAVRAPLRDGASTRGWSRTGRFPWRWKCF